MTVPKILVIPDSNFPPLRTSHFASRTSNFRSRPQGDTGILACDSGFQLGRRKAWSALAGRMPALPAGGVPQNSGDCGFGADSDGLQKTPKATKREGHSFFCFFVFFVAIISFGEAPRWGR